MQNNNNSLIHQEIKNYVENNTSILLQNVNYELSESISGLVINKMDKHNFPQWIQPYIYRDFR